MVAAARALPPVVSEAVIAELARGADAVDEAEILLGAGKLAGAVSRAYYGAFHHARAHRFIAAARTVLATDSWIAGG